MNTRKVVIDSSALFALFFPEVYSEWVEKVIRYYEELHVPELVFLETSSAAWKRIIVFKQPKDRVLNNLNLLHKFVKDVCVVHRDLDYVQRAIEISIELGVTVYDSLFLALAESCRAKLLTIDRRLVENLKSRKEDYRVLSPWNINNYSMEFLK